MRKLFYILFLCFVVPTFIKAQQTVELCEGKENTFVYSSDAGIPGNYLWTVNGVDYNVNPLSYTWTNIGVYSIRLIFTSTNGGCKDTTFYTVTVIECQETEMWFPNAFTPNENGLNETWSPKGFNYTDLNYYVYNRWGEQIYRSNSELTPWDGTYKGNDCQQDVYVFVARWRGRDGVVRSYVGHISLIR